MQKILNIFRNIFIVLFVQILDCLLHRINCEIVYFYCDIDRPSFIIVIYIKHYKYEQLGVHLNFIEHSIMNRRCTSISMALYLIMLLASLTPIIRLCNLLQRQNIRQNVHTLRTFLSKDQIPFNFQLT